MKKRDFIKVGVLGVVGFSSFSLNVRRSIASTFPGSFRLDCSKISQSAIRNIFSNSTIDKHYNKYILEPSLRLNEQLNKHSLTAPSLKIILLNPSLYSNDTIYDACKFYNHRLFFKQFYFGKKNFNNSALIKAINKNFGSINELQSKFLDQTKTSKGAGGWLWLLKNEEKLCIVHTRGEKNPLLDDRNSKNYGFPILGINIQKESYSSDFNSSEIYLAKIFENLDWQYLNKRYQRA